MKDTTSDEDDVSSDVDTSSDKDDIEVYKQVHKS